MIDSITLANVAKITKGKKAESYQSNLSDGFVRFIQIDDLRNDNELKYTDSHGVEVSPQDVIIAWDGANAGTIGYGLSGVIGSTLARLKIDTGKFDTGFLAKYLQSQSKYLREKATGATIPHIDKRTLLGLKIPFIPIAEQKRIAASLDRIDDLRRKRKEVIKLLDKYVQSMFLELFGDTVLNSKKWPLKQLGDVTDIRSGVTKGRKLDGSKTISVPYMRVANVQDGHINLNEIKEIEVLPSDIERYALRKNDILLTEGGDPDKLGRGAVWKGQIEVCIHQNHIFRVRIENDKLIPSYLSALIGSSYGKRYFLKAAKQTTGIASINMTQLKKFPVLIPDIKLQNEYEEVLIRVEETKQKMFSQLSEIDRQFNALMQKAFEENPIDAKVEEKESARKNMFDMIQVVGAVVEGFGKTNYQYGEMVIAKCVYLLQNVFDLPLNISFAKHNFGPYDNNIKKAVSNGLAQKYFSRNSYGSIVLGNKAATLIGKDYFLLKKSREAMDQLLPHIKNKKSKQIELLATICKIIQDSQLTDLDSIWEEMQNWKTTKRKTESKAELLTKDDTAKYLAYIKTRNWHQKLINS